MYVERDNQLSSCKYFCRGKPTNITLKRDTHLMQQFIYYYKQLYMFRASICPSSGVLGCIRIMLLHMVSSTIKENCALVGCHNVLYVYIAGIRGGSVCEPLHGR